MTVIDLSFPVTGVSVPRDHGYPLYAAITTHLPALHEVDWLGVHPISGSAMADMLLLKPTSDVRLRIPADRIPEVLGLAGARLNVLGFHLRLGAPSVHMLNPASSLDARLVLLSLTNAPKRHSTTLDREVLDNDAFADRYRSELSRQLKSINAEVGLELCGRRSLAIKGKRILGFSVRLTGLDPDTSLRVQTLGLGGRRTLGCGVFRPTRIK